MGFLKNRAIIVGKSRLDDDGLHGKVKMLGTVDNLTSLSCKIVRGVLGAVEKSDGEAGVTAYLLMLILEAEKEHKAEFVTALEKSLDYAKELHELLEEEE